MKQLAIQAENISKQYRLGEVGTGTLTHDLNRFWSKIRGKEDPYLKIGDSNDRTASGGSDYVWSLKDINFEIEQGDAVGIIGRNGAGKSTLLKLLSKVTKPTTGNFKVNGRIASLLEVGTGFNPEMTGRENIYMNGAILGMRRHEITRKFDEIVAFSGVEKYIDTPVKRYSSGMYVRLAFAVAAHLESEILIIDEVLAVGDADFQKKCLGKMGDVRKGEGRTIIFVSHNMAAVKSLCNKGIVLQNGLVVFEGNTGDSIVKYQNIGNSIDSSIYETSLENRKGNLNIDILKFAVLPKLGHFISISSGINIEMVFYNYSVGKNLAVTFELRNNVDVVVFHHGTWLTQNSDSKDGEIKVLFGIQPNLLNAGTYNFSVIFAASLNEVLYQTEEIVQFSIENESFNDNNSVLPGIIRPLISYDISYE